MRIALTLRLMLFLIISIEISLPVFSQQLINQRQIVLLEKARRTADPWPRGDGHVVLGEPGSPLSQKAYYEPGGSFSPSPGSFGLSIWIYDGKGDLLVTSDDIPLDDIKQRLIHTDSNKIPAIETATPFYVATWSSVEAGKWRLTIKQAAKNKTKLALVFRSVGPAGGPLHSVIWDSTRLLLNHRWLINPSAPPLSVITGNEESGGLKKSTNGNESVLSESGWAFARLDMDPQIFSVDIRDTKPQYKSMLTYEKTIPQFSMDLPDKEFEECLQAQVSHLLMGYIGRQTGPGEPVNYPLAWERDGAYSLVAMAKSGQLQTARELSAYFAENDFFGGFGSEGDAPGSAINALTEVAFLIDDPSYYAWVWPHIRRKLSIIDEMLNATGNVYKNYVGPLVPHLENEADKKRRLLIARKKEDELIVGTMDNHFPVLYINAISYRGLIQASRLATYFKDSFLASQCREKAAAIKAAWLNGFGKQKYANERNFMISIWPSWITNKDHALYHEQIEAKHQLEWGNDSSPKERPLWTYFTVAEAHQWLFLDRPDRVWETLHYFWNNQCSPGLYTFWEGNGEENTFRQWEHYRGWLQPRYVTPHYWTASEMTLLQLDMLVYVDESKEDYEIVIGAGVPTAWLSKPISVKQFKTKAGIVSWEYKNSAIQVTIQKAAKKYAVRPGKTFSDAGYKMIVSYK